MPSSTRNHARRPIRRTHNLIRSAQTHLPLSYGFTAVYAGNKAIEFYAQRSTAIWCAAGGNCR